jgi:hypothetical protein
LIDWSNDQSNNIILLMLFELLIICIAFILILLFGLVIIYVISILILIKLQSNIAARVNQHYAGKPYSEEYGDLVKRNNNYLEILSILLPFIDFTSLYVK